MTTQCWHYHTVLVQSHSVGMTTQCWHDHTVLVQSHSVGMTTQCWHDHTVLTLPHSVDMTTQCWQNNQCWYGYSVGTVLLTWLQSVDLTTQWRTTQWRTTQRRYDYKLLIWLLQIVDMTTKCWCDYKVLIWLHKKYMTTSIPVMLVQQKWGSIFAQFLKPQHRA